MKAFDPLPSSPNNQSIERNCETFSVSEFSVNTSSKFESDKASGPDGIPSWILKENSDILAFPVSEILNYSYQEACLPQSWKHTDIIPIPKQKPVREVNKHLRPISLTPI